MALERLDPTVRDELLKQQDIISPLEELRKETSIGVFLEKANTLAIKLYFSGGSDIFNRQRDANHGEIPIATIERAIQRRDFGTVSPDKPLFNNLVQAVAYKEQIGRGIIRHILSEREDKLDLTDCERIVLLGSLDMAEEFDELYLELNNYLLTSPTEKKLRDMGNNQATKLLKEKGLITPGRDYMYSVFDEDKGEIVSKSYFNVFINPIHRLGSILIDIAEKLEGLDDVEAKAYRDYFRAFKYALFSVNPEEQERLWRELDEVWMKITGRVQPIHPMETYSDTLRLRVEPSYVLAIFDDRYPEMQAKIQQTGEGVHRFLMSRYGASNSMKFSDEAVRNSKAGLYSTILSGARLAFMFAGENVPNREKVRLGGAKIFLIPESFRNRWVKQRELLVKIHTEENFQKFFPDEEKVVESSATVRIDGHEVGHNGFIMDGTRQKLGAEVEGYIEENKADLIIISAVPFLEHLDSRDRHNFIRSLYSASIATLEARNDHRRQAYYHSTLLILNAMVETDILTGVLQGKDNIGFHPEDDQAIAKFIDKVTAALDKMHQVYETLDPQKAKAFAKEYYIETEEIKTLERIISVDTSKPRDQQ